MASNSNFTFVDAQSRTPRETSLPETAAGMLSTSSSATDCFIKQRFNGNLQTFLVGYVNQIRSIYSIYQ